MRMDSSSGHLLRSKGFEHRQTEFGSQRRDPTYVAMGDAYFRRLLIPLVVTLLFMFGVVAIIYAPPGTELALPTAPTSLTVFNPLK